MNVATRSDELTAVADAALVPTMGALHDGHLSLIRLAKSIGGPVVVSIFVNPTQFGEDADLAAYPRPLVRDLEACRARGVDIVFAPPVEVVYPPDDPVAVPPLPIVATEPGLEDAHRPGHFAGMAQVVARLFDLVRPATAVFGEKDFQQLLVVRDMVAAHPSRWPGLRIVAGPIVRDPDGLAMSSRNVHIAASRRDAALALSQALREATAVTTTPADAEAAMRQVLDGQTVDVEYAVVRDATTLLPIDSLARPARALVAARVDDVRLIDNAALQSASREEERTPS